VSVGYLCKALIILAGKFRHKKSPVEIIAGALIILLFKT